MRAEYRDDLVCLAGASNPFEAHIWQQALREAGVRSTVLGDYLDAGIGNISGVRAEIWVGAADVARAEAILNEHLGRSESRLTIRPLVNEE